MGRDAVVQRRKPLWLSTTSKLGIGLRSAIITGVSSYWHLARTPATQQGMSNGWLKAQGLISIRDEWMKARGNI
jgi:hypothetical protein